MPPRYAYWTIIVDNQPTAFRAGALDDIMPTFNRLKEKQPTAKLMWFQSGKLWPSRIDAREAMQVRGERGRYSDPRQDGGDKTPSRERPKWKSKDFSAGPRAAKPSSREQGAKPEWKPKGSSSPEQRPKPEWKPRTSGEKPEWKPKGSSAGPPFKGGRSEGKDRPEGGASKPAWKARSASGDRPAWQPKGSNAGPPPQGGRSHGKDRPEWGARGGRRGEGQDRPEGKPEWKPKDSSARPEWKPRSAPVGRPSTGRQGEGEDQPEKRKWIPKAEYKKLTGTEAKRDDKWRPGGEHQDPRQKYKDAKKAKWGRFKQAIRSRAKKKS